jgi:Asp-tRNA(Asn)/Glu-tRNA(Gln) amidotransferase A subunit family amidase
MLAAGEITAPDLLEVYLERIARLDPSLNATGQPAAVVPWGVDRDGLPVAVQLVGRAADEATLLALSTQIESARPWAGRRPAIS